MGLFDKKSDDVLSYRLQQAESDLAEVKQSIKSIESKISYLEGANKASILEKQVDKLGERLERISTNLAQLQGVISKTGSEETRREMQNISIFTGDTQNASLNTGGGTQLNK